MGIKCNFYTREARRGPARRMPLSLAGFELLVAVASATCVSFLSDPIRAAPCVGAVGNCRRLLAEARRAAASPLLAAADFGAWRFAVPSPAPAVDADEAAVRETRTLALGIRLLVLGPAAVALWPAAEELLRGETRIELVVAVGRSVRIVVPKATTRALPPAVCERPLAEDEVGRLSPLGVLRVEPVGVVARPEEVERPGGEREVRRSPPLPLASGLCARSTVRPWRPLMCSALLLGDTDRCSSGSLWLSVWSASSSSAAVSSSAVGPSSSASGSGVATTASSSSVTAAVTVGRATGLPWWWPPFISPAGSATGCTGDGAAATGG